MHNLMSQRAEQEFYDEIDEILKNQPDQWHALTTDQKELRIATDMFRYYVELRRGYVEQGDINVDAAGLPVVFFRGIRLIPINDVLLK